jgi:two-component system, OmpR family, response regulator
MLNRNIAIVEDEAPLRDDLVAFFKLKGLQVFGYASAEDFFESLAREVFDLVILDIGLPGISGIDTASVLRQKTNIPILILTSHANHQTHLDSLNAGVDVFLSKSAPLEIIESSVRNMLARYQPTAMNPNSQLTSSNTAKNQRRADQAIWRLFVIDRVLKAPNHVACNLTYSETVFLQTLFVKAKQTLTRVEMLEGMGKEHTFSNLRNLDTYANRLRRKVLQETSIELPLRSAYNVGYTFAGEAYSFD